MDKKFIVTIARGYGSGGRVIGEMLSNKLGIEFYDKDLIKVASEESGISEDLFGRADEDKKHRFGWREKIYNGEIISPDKKNFTSEENLFNYQAKAIKMLAEKNSCIIVGRCADFVLKGFDNVVRVFLYANTENCLKNVADIKGIYDKKTALKLIRETDKKRAAYYKAHTGRHWMDARNYDLCLNTGELGFEKCIDIITSYIDIRLK